MTSHDVKCTQQWFVGQVPNRPFMMSLCHCHCGRGEEVCNIMLGTLKVNLNNRGILEQQEQYVLQHIQN